MPSTHVEYWEKKFARNVARDVANKAILEGMGWQVLVVWECELRFPRKVVDDLTALLRSQMR